MGDTIKLSSARAPKTSQSVPSYSVDTRQLKDFARSIRKLDPALYKNLRTGIHEIGDLIADAAKERARSFPRVGEGTDRIEGSIKVKQNVVSLRIVAGGDDAPEAAPIEHNGQPGSFRHPVFNPDVWVDQVAHPFLAQGADDVEAEVETRLLEVVDASLREVGFI